jgi:hypothetical protein
VLVKPNGNCGIAGTPASVLLRQHLVPVGTGVLEDRHHAGDDATIVRPRQLVRFLGWLRDNGLSKVSWRARRFSAFSFAQIKLRKRVMIFGIHVPFLGFDRSSNPNAYRERER